MSVAKYNIDSFVEFGQILGDHGLTAHVLPEEQKVEISDQYGNKIKRRFSDVLYGKEGCILCIRRAAERFDKLKFQSMRGVNAAKAGKIANH